MFIIEEEIYQLYDKIISGELIEKDMQYHEEIANSLIEDYDLAFCCFATCSIEFYMWFTKDYLYKLVEIIEHHNKKELLLLLKNRLVEMADNNPYDRRIDSIHSVYHVTYKWLR